MKVIECDDKRIDAFEITCTRLVHSDRKTGEPLWEETIDGTLTDEEVGRLKKGLPLDRTPIGRRVYK